MALRYKDYAGHGRYKTLHLHGGGFIRRYLLQLLPKDFARVRHYGFLAGCSRAQRLVQLRKALAAAKSVPTLRIQMQRAMHAITAIHCVGSGSLDWPAKTSPDDHGSWRSDDDERSLRKEILPQAVVRTEGQACPWYLAGNWWKTGID